MTPAGGAIGCGPYPGGMPAADARTIPDRSTCRGRRRSAVAGAATALAVLVSLAGCGRGDFPDRTAQVTIGVRTTTYDLDSCGLDGATAFAVGQSDGGAVLQAVLGLDAEKAGVVESSGLTFSDDGVALAAFGAESWSRRGASGAAPGTISSARLRGSRIQISGAAVPVDEKDQPTGSGDPVPFSLDARCDQ